MIDRKDIGSWLEGPRARNAPAEYPGQRLGMPPSGPGAIGTFGRRLVGIVIDWLIAQLIAAAFLGVRWGEGGSGSFRVLAVFAVMHLLLVGTLGSTIGHRVMGLRVVSVGGVPVRPLQAVVRTVLLCLGLPALIWDRDGRGMHDKVPNTVVMRTR